MAQQPPRVIRAFSLPVPQFDQLKTFQRALQLAEDREVGEAACEGDAHWIDNSKALANLIQEHGLMSIAADLAGMRSGAFATALHLRDLIPARDKGAQLPDDAAAHLEAYRVACGHDRAIDALAEIVRTHAVLAEMGAREGSSLSVIAKNAEVANEWHKRGVRGAPIVPENSATAH
ncbi:hypothetical protein ACEN9J_07710 [Variovorax sp. Varisp41]|uniref:hypothetical protein n=1 Tax=Variovorax sp. Varisp41 TaxID=3243033 RepID=UPI0039B4E32D